MASARRYEIDYFTATILEWKYLLADDAFKEIVRDSLKYLVAEGVVMVHAYVVMSNHIHLLWHILHPHQREHVQRNMMKFTAQMMIKMLRNNAPNLLADFYVGARDRKYQIWERNPLTIPLWTEDLVKQKLNYIHENPVRAGICTHAEDYKYSSARVYLGNYEEHEFITPIYF